MLNAFRHQRTDHFTSARWDLTATSAQRLSASTDGSLRYRGCGFQKCDECSTPFGINGRITRIATLRPQPNSECSTPFGINGRITTLRSRRIDCGIVLNAFRHQRTDHTLRAVPGTAGACAQRLSASTDGSPIDRSKCESMRIVLNAFRHQRTDHKRINGTWHGRFTVLNAFRHQRTDHERFAIVAYSRVACSTPFGINGRITVSA